MDCGDNKVMQLDEVMDTGNIPVVNGDEAVSTIGNDLPSQNLSKSTSKKRKFESTPQAPNQSTDDSNESVQINEVNDLKKHVEALRIQRNAAIFMKKVNAHEIDITLKFMEKLKMLELDLKSRVLHASLRDEPSE